MRSRGGWRVLLGLAFCLVVISGCATPASETYPPGPIRILLVNDDGVNAPGTTVLLDALRRAGHDVTVVTPVTRRDADGMKTTMSGDLPVRRPVRGNGVWAVDGTPADATLVGLRAVLARSWPYLVISGINSGRTVGISTLQSGAVGAAMTAAANSIPAMAVSTDVADPARARPEDFRRTADFVVQTVQVLQEQRTSPLLMPARTVLNVNYPAGSERPDGVIAARTAPEPSVSMFYRVGKRPETFTPVPQQREVDGGDNDATALRNGNVVLTDLSVDPDRSAPPPRVAARLAPALKP